MPIYTLVGWPSVDIMCTISCWMWSLSLPLPFFLVCSAMLGRWHLKKCVQYINTEQGCASHAPKVPLYKVLMIDFAICRPLLTRVKHATWAACNYVSWRPSWSCMHRARDSTHKHAFNSIEDVNVIAALGR